MVDGSKGVTLLDFAHNTVTAKIGGKTSILPMDCMMKGIKNCLARRNLRFEERMVFCKVMVEELVPTQNKEYSEIEPGSDMT